MTQSKCTQKLVTKKPFTSIFKSILYLFCEYLKIPDIVRLNFEREEAKLCNVENGKSFVKLHKTMNLTLMKDLSVVSFLSI